MPTLPLVSRHNRSAEPLPSKSPMPAIVQLSGTTPKFTVWATWVSIITHMPTSPVMVLRQKISPFMSAPTTDQVSGTLPSIAVEAMVDPFMNHIPRLPELSRHKMSPFPSALKSPVATTDQVVGTLPITDVEVTCVPFNCQTPTLPVSLRQRTSLVTWPFAVLTLPAKS